FGFLLPGVAAGLVWLRWRALRSAISRGTGAGLVPLGLGLALYLAGIRSRGHALVGVSSLPSAPGTAAFLCRPSPAPFISAPAAPGRAGAAGRRDLDRAPRHRRPAALRPPRGRRRGGRRSSGPERGRLRRLWPRPVVCMRGPEMPAEIRRYALALVLIAAT